MRLTRRRGGLPWQLNSKKPLTVAQPAVVVMRGGQDRRPSPKPQQLEAPYKPQRVMTHPPPRALKLINK